MASDDQDSKTEAPSARLLGKAREEGNLPLGRDLPLVASLVGAVAALAALGGTLRGGLVHAVGAAAGTLAETAAQVEADSLDGCSAPWSGERAQKALQSLRHHP